MTAHREAQLTPDFEIDHPDEFAPYLLKDPGEIAFYLHLMIKRSCLVTAYLDEGKQFFLTAIVGMDEGERLIFLDPAQTDAHHAAALIARQTTLNINLDRVKIQIRLGALQERRLEGRTVLSASIPGALLRLQRREFFRLEPPLTRPVECRVALEAGDGQIKTVEMRVADISGGGISLNAPTTIGDEIQLDTLLRNCRLDIPGEGVLLINLRVRKLVEISANTGTHSLRIGCEFIGLPGSRLGMIERYIARIERERKARESGLVD